MRFKLVALSLALFATTGAFAQGADTLAKVKASGVVTMGVRIYRERPTLKNAGKSNAQALWSYLEDQANTREKPTGLLAAASVFP